MFQALFRRQKPLSQRTAQSEHRSVLVGTENARTELVGTYRKHTLHPVPFLLYLPLYIYKHATGNREELPDMTAREGERVGKYP
jgi:hypothetical protein